MRDVAAVGEGPGLIVSRVELVRVGQAAEVVALGEDDAVAVLVGHHLPAGVVGDAEADREQALAGIDVGVEGEVSAERRQQGLIGPRHADGEEGQIHLGPVAVDLLAGEGASEEGELRLALAARAGDVVVGGDEVAAVEAPEIERRRPAVARRRLRRALEDRAARGQRGRRHRLLAPLVADLIVAQLRPQTTPAGPRRARRVIERGEDITGPLLSRQAPGPRLAGGRRARGAGLGRRRSARLVQVELERGFSSLRRDAAGQNEQGDERKQGPGIHGPIIHVSTRNGSDSSGSGGRF